MNHKRYYQIREEIQKMEEQLDRNGFLTRPQRVKMLNRCLVLAAEIADFAMENMKHEKP